ncbi:hypothetical protein ACN28E_08165 [Archangium lansingense]|uniref:hypothetical protein n=1 Tax=Archangium lansingense TaxID=2995310 RepID=UPI003B79B312
MRKPITAVCLVLLLAACPGTPRLRAIHDPLYRAENHTSTITARATEDRDGIASVRIDATIGELTACTSSVGAVLPSLIPCRTGASSVSAVCEFANVKTEVTCSLPLSVTARQLITYSATALSARNRSASSGSVTYAGGEPLAQATINPTGLIPIVIPWETARPVIWRTDAPSAGTARGDKIDWGFLPDADMPNYRAFTDDMQPMVLALLYNDTNQFSTWTRTWNNIFNVWAGPTGGDAEGCTRTFDTRASAVRSAFDGAAILHRNAFRDCASLSLGGGAGSAQTNLGDASWVLLHESGHFLFGLGDEYVGGGNTSVSSPRNVVGSQADCQSASSSNSLPSSQCVQIGTSGTWRNDDGQATTMEDRVPTSDWRTLSGSALNNRINACVNGACY